MTEENQESEETTYSPYTIPQWFVSSSLRTNQQLQETHVSMLCDALEINSFHESYLDGGEDVCGQKEFENTFPLRIWIQSVRDTLRASLVRGKHGAASSFPPSVLLRRADGEDRERAEAIVQCLALSLSADLITLELDDLDELCCNLIEDCERKDNESDQDIEGSPDWREDVSLTDTFELDSDSREHPAILFFGGRSQKHASALAQRRNKYVMAALIQALQKLPSREGDFQHGCSIDDQTRKPILVHMPDTETFDEIRRGGRFFTRMRDQIMVWRQSGVNILMIVSTRSAKSTYCCGYGGGSRNWEKTYSKLHIDAASTFDIPECKEIHRDNSAPKSHARHERLQGRNIRGLKKSLRLRLSHDTYEDLLRPSTNWDLTASGKVLDLIRSRPLTEDEIKRATRQIFGRTWEKSKLCIEDICGVLAGLPDVARPVETPKKPEVKKSDLKSMLYDCDEYESRLKVGIVDRAQLTSGYESVVFDDDAKQLVATLLKMSAIRGKNVRHPLLGTLQSRGALFYGPPGTGKTHLCRAIAKESNMTMLAVDGANVLSEWIGENEKLIRAVFSLAEKLHPCIVFLDEVDALFGHRISNQRSWERSIVTQFLKEMDGLASSERSPFVIVATNRPGDLDEAFLRRLSHKVLFSLPSVKQREEIFKICLEDVKLDEGTTFATLASATPGYSGSDIRSLCGAAALAWATNADDMAMESTSGGKYLPLHLTAKHFQGALERSIPSVTQKSISHIERFEQRFKQRTLKRSLNVSDPTQRSLKRSKPTPQGHMAENASRG